MATEKRERQRQNRAKKQKIEAANAKKASTFKTIRNLGLIAVAIVGVVLAINFFGGEDEITITNSDAANPEDIDQLEDFFEEQGLEGADDDSEIDILEDLEEESETAEQEEVVESSLPCPPVEGSDEQVQSFDGIPPSCLEDGVDYSAVLDTSFGTVEIDLAEDIAPITVNNFVYLSRYQYYDGLTFHRIVEDFVIQGGDPDGTGSGGPGYRFEDELPEDISAYQQGTVAMANAGPDTNGSQFFIVTTDDWPAGPMFSVFGEVTEGFDNVLEVQQVEVGPGDAPLEDVIINSVEIIES